MESSRDEVYSRRVRAGKRTYYIDVRSTRSGNDFYLTITESKRGGEEEREKFKIFLYKEDFEKFREAFNQALDFVYIELGKINALPRVHARDEYQREDHPREEYQRSDERRFEAPSREESLRSDEHRFEAPSREETRRNDELSPGFGSSDYQTPGD